MLIKKIIPWKLRILNSKNFGVIFIRKERFMATFFCMLTWTHSLTHTGRISSETYITPKHDYTTKPHDLNGNTLNGIFNKVILR